MDRTFDRRSLTVTVGALVGVAAAGRGWRTGAQDATPPAGQALATPPVATPVPDELPTELTVEMIDLFFVPSEFSIPANTDVTVFLPNRGLVVHNFFSDDLGVFSETAAPGGETAVTINAEPGEYGFYCAVPGHRESGMVGTVHVE
jgi:plastocyanin